MQCAGQGVCLSTASSMDLFYMPECRTVRYRNEQHWDKGTQSGTGMFPYRTEIQDAGRNADTGGIDIDADAQLCQFPCFPINFQESIRERA